MGLLRRLAETSGRAAGSLSGIVGGHRLVEAVSMEWPQEDSGGQPGRCKPEVSVWPLAFVG